MGNPEATPNWPFRVRLVPNDPCGFPADWHGPFHENLTNGCIPPGTRLFDVHALDKPEALGGEEKLIGKIYTTSEMVTSIYGDTRLFFRHKRFEEDLEARPNWVGHVQEFTHDSFPDLLPLPSTPPPTACPFSFLFGLPGLM